MGVSLSVPGHSQIQPCGHLDRASLHPLSDTVRETGRFPPSVQTLQLTRGIQAYWWGGGWRVNLATVQRVTPAPPPSLHTLPHTQSHTAPSLRVHTPVPGCGLVSAASLNPWKPPVMRSNKLLDVLQTKHTPALMV